MKVILLILHLILLQPLQGHCQFFVDEFEEEINAARSLYAEGKFAESALIYESALRIVNDKYPLSGFYYNASLALIRAGSDKRKIYSYLENWVKSSWVDSTLFFENSEFIGLKNDIEWENLCTYVHNRNEQYQEVQNQLILIGKFDQEQRLEAVSIQEEFGKSSEEYKSHWESVAYQDSLNLIEVESIISQHGWLGECHVGSKASNTLWKVIQHASDEIRQKYFPLIEESVHKGQTQHSKLALLKDRLLINQGKKQLFGSQFFTDDITGEIRVYPILNPENINKKRNSIGLSDIETYLKFCGMDTITENTFSDTVAVRVLSNYIK